MNGWKKAVLAVTTCASLVAMAAPAQAERYRYRGYRHHDNGGAVIAGGIVGLALGAAIASSSRDRYYDRGYRGDGYYRDGYRDRGYYRGGYDRGDYYRGDRDGYYDRRRYRGGYDGYRRCRTDRYYDDYRGGWTQVQRCD